MSRLQYFEAPKPTDVTACRWPAGEKFLVAKVDPADLHSAWYVVEPGGGMLMFNDCADDAWDEARANWVATALNSALANSVEDDACTQHPECPNAFMCGGRCNGNRCADAMQPFAASAQATQPEGSRVRLDAFLAAAERDGVTHLKDPAAQATQAVELVAWRYRTKWVPAWITTTDPTLVEWMSAQGHFEIEPVPAPTTAQEAEPARKPGGRDD